MENNQPRIPAVALRYGLIAGLLVIIYSLILQFTELYMSKGLSYISFLLVLGCIIFAFRHYKSHNEGYMSFGQGLGLGTLTAVIAGVLGGIFSYVYVKFIDDSMVGKMIEMQQEEMEKQGFSNEKIEQAMQFSAFAFTAEGFFVFSIISFLFYGFLMSLVASTAMRNARPDFQY